MFEVQRPSWHRVVPRYLIETQSAQGSPPWWVSACWGKHSQDSSTTMNSGKATSKSSKGIAFNVDATLKSPLMLMLH